MWAVLTEGGVVESAGPSKVKYWGIEFAQKRFGRIDFCAERAEPLEALAALLWQTGKSEPRPEIAPAVRSFLASYGPTRDLAMYQRLLRDPDALVADPERMRQLPPFLQSLFRDELVPAPVVAEPGGGYRLLVAVHLLPDSELGSVLEELLPDWKRFGLTAGAPSEAGARTASPLDHPVYLALRDLVAAERPEAPVGPYFLPWSGTDARFFRTRGIPSYGFSPFAVSVTETLQLGKPNERMQLPAFVAGVRLYREAVRRLLE
jgi:hypothetical protein